MRASRTTRGPDLLTWQDRKRSRRGYYELIPAPTEQQWHIDLVKFIRTRRLLTPGWRMTHFPAGGERTAQSGAIMKALGLERGWPDLLLARPKLAECPIGLPHGLELKRLGGEPTDEQKDVRDWFWANGWPWDWADNIQDALRILREWGALRLEVRI